MSERLPDLVLDCWIEEGDRMLVTEDDKGFVSFKNDTCHGETEIVLSSHMQDQLRRFLDDIAMRRRPNGPLT